MVLGLSECEKNGEARGWLVGELRGGEVDRASLRGWMDEDFLVCYFSGCVCHHHHIKSSDQRR